MWIFLNDAFLSVVADRNSAGHLLVRARFPGDIERTFPEAQVKRTPAADYLFRARVLRSEVAAALSEHVLNIDYPNFKGSIPGDDFRRHNAYMDVWREMNSAQYHWED